MYCESMIPSNILRQMQILLLQHLLRGFGEELNDQKE